MFLYIYPPTPVSVTVPPIEYIQDGVNTQVAEDTANAANNRGLPVLPTFYKDGTPVTVNIDTVTPANNRPLPVELAGTSGTVTINAGDLNVSTSAVNDSMSIGDGVTGSLAEVDLNDDASTYALKVKDDDANTKLGQIETAVELIDNSVGTKGSATSTQGLRILGSDGTNDQQIKVSATGEVQVDIASSALPSGASTLTEQQTQTTHLGQIEAAVELIDNAVNVDANPAGTSGLMIGGVDGSGDFQRVSVNTAGELSVTFGSAGFATETTLSALNNKHNADFGASSGSIRTAAQVGNATGAADFNSGADSAQTLRVSANLKRAGNELSYNSGTVDANTLRVIPASDYIPPQPAAMTASFQEDATVSTSAETFTAPANAKCCVIQAPSSNTVNLRIKIGGTASTTSGMVFEPGRSETFPFAGNISYCSESGSGQAINVHFGT